MRNVGHLGADDCTKTTAVSSKYGIFNKEVFVQWLKGNMGESVQ